jgi:DNA-binding HxlR family transcriptional regulator
MRTYGHQCAIAAALDVIGARWSLLIVRELMIRGSCRYTDLQCGLPGIATNMLTERLKDLQQSGVIERLVAPPPVATALFRLTPRGEALKPVIADLGRWGGPLVAGDNADRVFRDHWVILPLQLYVRDTHPEQPAICVAVYAGTERFTIATQGDGTVAVTLGTPNKSDALIQGPPLLVLALLTAGGTLTRAQSKGLQYDGDPDLLKRFGVR